MGLFRMKTKKSAEKEENALPTTNVNNCYL
jgi:hypothetical protein